MLRDTEKQVYRGSQTHRFVTQGDLRAENMVINYNDQNPLRLQLPVLIGSCWANMLVGAADRGRKMDTPDR
jgi:hypothetical protein